MISDILNETEKKLARELAEAEPEFRLKMACNLVKSDPANWAVITEAHVPGLAEQVREALAGNEEAENLTPQQESVNIPLKNTPHMI